MLVGLFEPVAAPWSLDGVPADVRLRRRLPPDWDRIGPFLGVAMDRIPSLSDDRDPDVLLRPGVVHLRRASAARSGARAGRLLRGRRPELARDPARRRRRQRHRAAGSSTASPPVDMTGYAIDRVATYETLPTLPRRAHGRAARGAVRRRAPIPTWKPTTGARRPALGHPRPAGRRGRALQRPRGLGVRRVVRRRRRAPERRRWTSRARSRSRSSAASTVRSARPSASWT